MSDLYWLTDEQMARLEPYFPRSHGRPRVDDRRVLSGIIVVNRNGLRWRDAPKDYGPHKTLYNRWKRWGAAGAFARTMEGLSSAGADRKTVMIDATYLKAHRTASSLAVKRSHAARSPVAPDPRDPANRTLGRNPRDNYIPDLRLGSGIVPGQPTEGIKIKPRDFR